MSSLTSRLARLSRRARVLAAGALVLVLAAGAGGYFLVRAYQDARRPTPVFLNVRDGQREVPLDQALVLTAPHPLPPAAVAAAFRISPAVEVQETVAADRQTFTWRPSQPWADLTRYTVRLGAIKDEQGHPVKAATWHFTTTIVPRVRALTTSAGSAVADGATLPLGTGLRLEFNEAMDPATVTLTANGAPLALHWSDDHVSAALDPGGLRAGPLELVLGAGGRDPAGRAVAAWKLDATLVFHVNVHTQPLPFPALVQVPNDPSARDQSGLQAASVVFESVAEGGITRFSALFTAIPDTVGPIRSGRLISFKLARHYHAELFASGLSQGSTARLDADPVPHQFDTPGVYYRTASRYPPNNLFINAASILAAEARTGLPAFALPAGSAAPLAGSAVAGFGVAEHRSSYAFDPVTGTYSKTEDGHLMADAALGAPLRIQMVVVLHTRVTVTGIIEDSNRAHGLDYDLDASGRAEFYSQGKMAAGTWSSANRSSPLTFKLDSGAEVPLPPGLVWIDVVG